MAPVSLSFFTRRPSRRMPGVVDQAVQPPHRLEGPRDEGADVRLVGDVELAGVDFPGPLARDTVSSPSSFTSPMATCAPASARRRAKWRPMPPAAPETHDLQCFELHARTSPQGAARVTSGSNPGASPPRATATASASSKAQAQLQRHRASNDQARSSCQRHHRSRCGAGESSGSARFPRERASAEWRVRSARPTIPTRAKRKEQTYATCGIGPRPPPRPTCRRRLTSRARERECRE